MLQLKHLQNVSLPPFSLYYGAVIAESRSHHKAIKLRNTHAAFLLTRVFLSCLSFRCIPQALNKSNPAWYQLPTLLSIKKFFGALLWESLSSCWKEKDTKILCLPFFQSSAHNIDALTLPSFEGEKRPTKVIAFHKSPLLRFFLDNSFVPSP